MINTEQNRQEFETWYASKKLSQAAKWNPDLDRYTVFSTKQFAYEIWNAARGIVYEPTDSEGRYRVTIVDR